MLEEREWLQESRGVLRVFWGMLCVALIAWWYLWLPLVTSYVTLLHVGSVVIFLALNFCFVAFQISLYALNSSEQMPVWSDWHGKLKCTSLCHLSPGHDCGCLLVTFVPQISTWRRDVYLRSSFQRHLEIVKCTDFQREKYAWKLVFSLL